MHNTSSCTWLSLMTCTWLGPQQFFFPDIGGFPILWARLIPQGLEGSRINYSPSVVMQYQTHNPPGTNHGPRPIKLPLKVRTTSCEIIVCSWSNIPLLFFYMICNSELMCLQVQSSWGTTCNERDHSWITQVNPSPATCIPLLPWPSHYYLGPPTLSLLNCLSNPTSADSQEYISIS